MSDEPKKKKKNDENRAEWSFDLGKLGESISQFFDGVAGDEELHHSRFETPKAGVTAADVNIQFSVGENNLWALSEGDNLLEADLMHVGEVLFDVKGDSEKSVTLRQEDPKNMSLPFLQGARAISDSEKLRWNVGLAPDMPLALEVRGGVGPVNLELSKLSLSKLRVQGGVGAFTVVLPPVAERIRVDIQAGVGAIRVTVPEGCNADIHLKGGVGTVDVFVPDNTSLRLKGRTGIGSISVPDYLTRTKGTSEFMDNSGVWESADYTDSDRGVLVNYTGGIGSLRVRTPQVV